jgi:peptide deformylase
MAVLDLRLYPDPILRQKARPVVEFGSALENLVSDLLESMCAHRGIGLAAPQVGISQRVAVVDLDPGGAESHPFVLVNPEILLEEGRVLDSEGCLSIPGLTEKVVRPRRVRVRAQDARGEFQELEGEGLLARAFCHEIDHLDGILFIDRLTGLRRESALRRLKRLLAEAEA